MAGPAFYRAVAASGERDRLLFDSLRSRRRAWRPGDGLIFPGTAYQDNQAKHKRNSRTSDAINCAFDKINPREKGGFPEARSRFHIGAYAAWGAFNARRGKLPSFNFAGRGEHYTATLFSFYSVEEKLIPVLKKVLRQLRLKRSVGTLSVLQSCT
jgi:hypothetical protein